MFDGPAVVPMWIPLCEPVIFLSEITQLRISFFLLNNTINYISLLGEKKYTDTRLGNFSN